MAFAGLEGQEEGYGTTLEAGLEVPVRWPEDCYVESLVRVNERRERRRVAEREGVEFVPARVVEGSGSGGSTPGEGRKSKFRA